MAATLAIAWLLALGAAPDASAGRDADADAGELAEPQVVVSAHLEPAEVRLGEPFELVVELQRPTGETFELPAQIRGPDVEVLAAPQRALREQAGAIVETVRLKLAAYRLRDAWTPAIKLRSTRGTEIEVAPLPIKVVRSVDAQENQEGLAEALAPVSLERFDERPIALLAALALLGLLVWGFGVLDRRRPALPERLRPTAPERPYDLVALERLAALEQSPLIQRGELEPFVEQVIDVMRWYLGQRYALGALDMTSGELVQALGRVLDVNLDPAAIDRILVEADLVKFARAPTTARACAQLVQSIRALVLATRPLEQAEAA
ncbi:MAG: hypothetical protein JXR83_12075 [Deltaproteobacteria bacterium]|nr:hypothetical protein [Deltaproteobacteria bacterium]